MFRFPWLLAAVLAASGALADYPERPIRFIVPQAAGSATDNYARLLAPELASRLGQPIVVDDRPGGALTIGIDAVAKSAPDGYTIGMGPVGAPMLDWMLAYHKEWLRLDVIAGLTTAAVVIPKAMAYATIAGLPVQVGLYTAFLPMLIYAIFGTSRPLSVSTSTTIAILVAAQLGQVVPDLDRLFANPASSVENLFYFGFLAERLSYLVGQWLTPPLIGLMYTAHEISNPEYWYGGMNFVLIFVGVTIWTAIYLWRRGVIAIWLGDGFYRFVGRLF